MGTSFDPALWLAGLVACPPLFFLGVVLATLLLEDLTALAVGALGAAMQVDPVLGLSALLFGTVLGDVLLHFGGRLGRGRPWVARRMASAPRVARLARSPWMVAAARVVPGLRVPSYVGSGVAGMPIPHFLLVVTATGLLWTPLLYLAGGELTGPLAWVALPLLALALLLAPRLSRRSAAA